MSHWVWHNVWQVNNSWAECDYCLNYDSQTCCLVFLPTALALCFFGWLFFQKGHLAVGLVLAQLLAIILLGLVAFLLAMALRRCWRTVRHGCQGGSAARKKCSTVSSSVEEA